MVKHYIFEDGKVKEASLEQWCIFLECCDRHLAETMVGDIIWVSTVFLGLDHSFSRTGPPVLWETMIFDWKLMEARRQDGRMSDQPKSELLGDLDNYQARYRSVAQAQAGHLKAVNRALEFYPDLPVIHKVCECGKHGEDYDLRAYEIHESFVRFSQP